MNKRSQKKAYCVPQCLQLQLGEATYLMNTSFPGQHNPAHHGSGPSSAKQAMMWEEDEDPIPSPIPTYPQREGDQPDDRW